VFKKRSLKKYNPQKTFFQKNLKSPKNKFYVKLFGALFLNGPSDLHKILDSLTPKEKICSKMRFVIFDMDIQRLKIKSLSKNIRPM
jgi:hypothetical protein